MRSRSYSPPTRTRQIKLYATSPQPLPMRMYPKESIVNKNKSILKQRKAIRTVRRTRLPTTSKTVTKDLQDKEKQGTEIKKPEDKKHLTFKPHHVKVLIIESEGEYCTTIWLSIGTGLVHMAVAAVSFAVLQYTFVASDAHIALCSIGYHFFSTEAILSLHFDNGWSTPMRLRYRRFAHVSLNFIALLLVISGTVLAYLHNGSSKTMHGITGYFAALVIVISAFTGISALFWGKRRVGFIIGHAIFGLTCFILSSISLCSILMSDKKFIKATPVEIVHIMIGLVIFYTMFIFVSSFSKCISRIQ